MYLNKCNVNYFVKLVKPLTPGCSFCLRPRNIHKKNYYYTEPLIRKNAKSRLVSRYDNFVMLDELKETFILLTLLIKRGNLCVKSSRVKRKEEANVENLESSCIDVKNGII